MNVRRILCIVSALCIVCGLAGCGRKGEETVSSAAPESASSAAAASNAVEIPFVVVPELTVRYVDMVQVVNVQEGSTLNVREGPGTDYASIGKANPGESFEYLGDEGGWSMIRFGEATGYVSPDYSAVVSVPAS